MAGACVTATGDESTTLPTASASPAPDASAASAAPTQAASGPPTDAPGTPTPPAIGYIALDGSQSYVQAITTGVREAAGEAGLELVECDAGASRAGVEACARQLAEADVAGLISMQPFGDVAEQVCAITGDVPVVGIVYEQGPCQVSLLEVDQVESGRLAGAALGALAAERWDCDVRSYVELQSGTGDVVGADRMAGFLAGYREHCKLPRDRPALPGAQYLITAQTQMAELLDKNAGKPIVVAGVTDLAALGALRAAREAGRQNHVWVAGQLADPAARAAIACDRHYVASVAQFPDRFGDVIVPILVEALAGREVAPRLQAELALVTSGNVGALFPDTRSCDT